MDDENDFDNEEPLEEMFSLDDLSAAYARAIAESGGHNESSDDEKSPAEEALATAASPPTEDSAIIGTPDADSEDGVDPQMIVEAALFVGHPNNTPITAVMIAKTMRGVSAVEVEQMIDQLNRGYRQSGHAFQVHREGDGYRMGICDSMRKVQGAFAGKVRETRLNQPAIDVLSLIAYQPGITLATINEQRGKDSGAIVNQLVRRELLEVKRETSTGPRPPAQYFPTVRLLNLLGIESLDDLPMVDDSDVSPLS